MVVGVENLRIDMKQIKDRGARPKIGASAAQEMLDKARALALQRSKAARGEALKLLQKRHREGQCRGEIRNRNVAYLWPPRAKDWRRLLAISLII